MPVPPPPPPPPPPATVKAPIPKSNKQLLQSIEKGTNLRKVPESAKNDRSSGLVAAGVGANVNGSAAKPSSQNLLGKSAMNNGSNDFQYSIMNHFLSMKPGSNNLNANNQERKASIPANNYVKPSLGYNPSSCPPTNLMSLPNNNHRAPLITNNHSSSAIDRRTPPPVASSTKPVMQKAPPLLVAKKPAPAAPISMPSAVSLRSPPPNQLKPTNNGVPPPPPPTKSKPTQRNSISVEPYARTSVTSASGEPHLRPRPYSQAPSTDNSTSLPVVRTTGNPPPPLPGPFRPPMTRTSTSSATSHPHPPAPPPPPPSRISGQFSSIPGTMPPYKVIDRAPPPPPPMVPSTVLANYRSSHISDTFGAFDRRFVFPDESLFPRL